MAAKGLLVCRLSVALLPLMLLGWPSSSSADGQPFPRQSDGEGVCGAQGRFQVNGDTIIRTQDSRLLGAKYMNETELPSQRQCLAWCCQTAGCNVAVFEQKDKGSCYLFDCGPSTDFKCKFTAHHHYSSAILDTSPPSDNSAPDGGGKSYPPMGDEHIAALKNLKNQVHPVATEVQKSGETETVTKPGPTTAASTTVVVPDEPVETSKPNGAVAPGKPNAGECTHFQFQCRHSGECIAVYNACDGIPQCSDGSDESEDLGCPTDGRHFLASPSALEKPSFNENVPLTSGQADKPRPVQNPENPHRPTLLGNPAPPRAASAHAAKIGHRGQKPEAPKPNPNSQPKEHHKFEASYDSQQGALQSPDARHYGAPPTGHSSGFVAEGHPKESGAPPTRYDHAYPKAGSPPKLAPEAHLPPQTYHRAHGSGGGDSLVEEADSLEQSSVARQSFDKGRNPVVDHRIPASDDGSRHYYDVPPQYDAGRQDDSDSNPSGQYGSDRTNSGYAREYYEGGYAPSNTDYAQKDSHYQQQDGQYVAHDPLYGHHTSDVHPPKPKNQNWPPHQLAYDGRNSPDSLDQSSGPDHQGAYDEHRYPGEPLRPVNPLDIPSDHVIGHGQGGRQDYGSDQLDHEENTEKYWPLAANHIPGSQPSVKKTNQDTGGLQAPLHQKQVPIHPPSSGLGGRSNTKEPQASQEEVKEHAGAPPPPPTSSQSPIRPEETKAVSKMAAKPQHRVSHVELNLAEVEVTKAERSSESSGAILALTLGLSITGLMLVLVGCRLRMVRRRLRRGRSPYAHDADYLVNGMYL